jgi:hypothetical protein
MPAWRAPHRMPRVRASGAGDERSRVEIWEGSGGFGFGRQLLVLVGSLLYDFLGTSHVVFGLVHVVCWCAHTSEYPQQRSPNKPVGES